MKKDSKKRNFIFVLCIAVLLSNISPSITVYADAEQTPEASESQTPAENPEASESQTPSANKEVPEVIEKEELDYILGRPMTEEEVREQEAMMPENLPLLPEEIPVEGYDGGISLFALPEESYDSRDYGYITEVKNQNPYGSCWTYATMASLESSLIVGGIVDNACDVDLSEWHLAYYATHSGSDELGNTTGDYVKPLTGTGYMNNGGNAQMAAVALSNWKGIALESAYPGNPDRNILAAAGENMTPDDAWVQNSYRMTNCYMVPADDFDSIKKLIQSFGAVYGSYYQSTSCYNSSTASYYCNNKTSSNHAITIVGWDDNYSKANFKTEPDNDGAWICKNSWGSNWGKNGYFYISYEDTSISHGNVTAFDGEMADNSLNNYYYDGGVDISTYDYVNGIAQCYAAGGNKAGAEEIEGVGFFTYNSGVSYEIQIYKNPKMKNGVVTNPESGKAMLKEPERGSTSYAGYCTIDLNTPVSVNEGDIFSVVITFDDRIALMMDNTKRLTSGGITVYDSVNETASGESFVKWKENEEYIDLYLEKDAYTPRMNIITRDVPKKQQPSKETNEDEESEQEEGKQEDGSQEEPEQNKAYVSKQTDEKTTVLTDLNLEKKDEETVKSIEETFSEKGTKAPVELRVVKDNVTTQIGFYTTFMSAVKVVEERKDKSAVYYFIIHDGLKNSKPEKIDMPVYAESIWVKKAMDAKEAVLNIASDIILKSDTTFEDICMVPCYEDGRQTIRMGSYALTMIGITLPEGSKINKITSDSKFAKPLEIKKGAEQDSLTVNSLAVQKLIICSNAKLFAEGKTAVGFLTMEKGSLLSLGGENSEIANVIKYAPCRTETAMPGEISMINIKSNADLIINNISAKDIGGKLYIEKENIGRISVTYRIPDSPFSFMSPRGTGPGYIFGNLQRNFVVDKAS